MRTGLSPVEPSLCRTRRPFVAAALALAWACSDDGERATGDPADVSDVGDDGAGDAEADAPADGSGDSSDDASGDVSDAPDPGTGCELQCDALALCAPDAPSADEIEACVAACEQDLALAPESCGEAHESFARCFAERSCDELRQGPPVEGGPCHDEYMEYSRRCFLDALPTCRARGEFGDPCESGESCAAGLACDPESSACVAAPGEGEPCADGVLCGAGLACDFGTGVCGSIPGDGEPCALGPSGPVVCADGLACLASSTGPFEAVCTSLPGDGETCSIDNRCAAGLGCDFSPEGSLCRPLRGVGGRCEADHICEDGTYCEFSELECTAYLEVGAPCNDGNECGPQGSCMPISANAFACAPLPRIGDRCLFDCEAGAVCAR